MNVRIILRVWCGDCWIRKSFDIVPKPMKKSSYNFTYGRLIFYIVREIAMNLGYLSIVIPVYSYVSV